MKWDTPQGPTTGRVVRKVTRTTTIKGHTAKATKDQPQYEVRSDKTGGHAIHKPGGLRKAD